MDWSHKTLNLLGLNKNEQKILDVLGVAKNVQQIAQDSKLSRTGIVHILKHLKNRGLIKKIKIGKRNLYLSIDKNILLKKMKQISDQIILFESEKRGVGVKISHQDEFVIHVGAQEIVPAYQRIAFENKNDRIRAIQHHKSWLELNEKVSPQQLIDFNQAIIENHLILDGMLNEGAYDSYRQEILANPNRHKDILASLSGRMADYTIFDDNFFNYSTEIWIFKNTALIINWRDEVAIEVTNKDMTAFLKDMFEFVKMGGKKIDHNKMMREIFEKEKDL